MIKTAARHCERRPYFVRGLQSLIELAEKQSAQPAPAPPKQPAKKRRPDILRHAAKTSLLILLTAIALLALSGASQGAFLFSDERFLWMGTYYDEVTILYIDEAKKTATCSMHVATKLDYESKIIPVARVPAKALDEYKKSNSLTAINARLISALVKDLEPAIAEASTAEGRERLKAKAKAIREVNSDLPLYRGKMFWISGRLDVSSSYGFAYRDAKETHFAFQLMDRGGYAYLYGQRSSTTIGALRKRILASDSGGAQMLCLVAVIPERDQIESFLNAELLYAVPAN